MFALRSTTSMKKYVSCSWDPVPCIQLSAVIHYWILVCNSKLFCSGPNVFSPLKIAFRPMSKMFWSYERTRYYLYFKKNLCVQPACLLSCYQKYTILYCFLFACYCYLWFNYQALLSSATYSTAKSSPLRMGICSLSVSRF